MPFWLVNINIRDDEIDGGTPVQGQAHADMRDFHDLGAFDFEYAPQSGAHPVFLVFDQNRGRDGCPFLLARCLPCT